MAEYADYNEIIPVIEYFVERKSWPTWHIDQDEIDFYDLTYIIDGKATYIVNGRPYQLVAGDLIYIQKGNLRQAYTDKNDPMHCFAFIFNYYTNKTIDIPIKTKSSIGLAPGLINMYKEFNRVWLEKEITYIMESRGIFMKILAKLIKIQNQSDSKHDLRIERVKNYIINNYNKKLEIKVLADLINLSPIYLGSLFKEVTGYSVNQYINMIRINKAEGLLIKGECNVQQAAYYCGFNDPFYFSKVFKELKGLPPSNVISRS